MQLQQSRAASKSPRIGAVIIGDEILSGKIEDTNSTLLIRVLRRRGANLRRLVIVGDEPSEIGHEVRSCSETFDYVITSGGVGPTHDDRTMAGIAAAFEVPVVRHPDLESLIHAHLGVRVNDAALKMAEVPEGATLLATDRFPLVRFRNIFVLPGVPSIFRRKLEFVARALQGTPSVVERVVLGCYESDVAQDLASVHDRHGLVSVGSYPRDEDGRDVVLVTLESRSGAAAAAALEDLLHRLPAGVVLRVESEGLRS